ncbi:MAG: hypothetical protein KJN90_14750, partial [Gammaproteobacteria bacterium]|nr:hypothetical protein [Gammaproteobacteria bacterium]
TTHDGAIRLKRGQRLLGADQRGRPIESVSTTVQITNSGSALSGSVVQLSSDNEIAGLHFVDLKNHGIVAGDENISGAYLHHNIFTNSAASDQIIWSLLLVSESGVVDDVEISDSVFRDGRDMGGIQVLHQSSSYGNYFFRGNEFKDLGGRAYQIQSMHDSRVNSIILNSSVDNIGRGDRNSDSVLPYLQGSSSQTLLVKGFHYNNSQQVGNESNTGMEAFLMGNPFVGEEHWCDGCRLALYIEDSVFKNTITDGIQLTNFGSNSIVDIEIRNVQVLNANPRQAGGAISLIAENAQNSGSRSTLLIENSDMIDSSGYGFVVVDQNTGYTSTVDLGGGVLGSKGNNRIVNNANGEVMAIQANPVARNNWWGAGVEPAVTLQGDRSTIDWQTPLSQDPR